MIILLFDREEISDLQYFVQNMPTVAVSLKFLAMSASWENKRVAKKPVELATLAFARRVNCLDPRRDLSVYWVTADAGSRPGRDGSSRFIWDFAIRRELEDRPGWLAKAINPFPHRSREYAGGGHRWDLVLELSMVRPTEKNSRHEGRNDQQQLRRHCDDDQLPFEHLEELLQSVATGLRPAFKPGGLPAPTLRSTTLGDKFPLAGRWWAAFSRRPVSVSSLRARGRHAS